MAPRDDRWDWVEGLRPQSAMDIVASEAGKNLAAEILAWPPQVRWTDPAEQAKFAPLFAADAVVPGLDAIALGIELARLELRHEHDAVAHVLRNTTVRNAIEVMAARFLWRWMTEWLFELNERTDSRIPRAQLVTALDHCEARVRAALAHGQN